MQSAEIKSLVSNKATSAAAALINDDGLAVGGIISDAMGRRNRDTRRNASTWTMESTVPSDFSKGLRSLDEWSGLLSIPAG
jgi:hypothetical protein